MIQGYNAQTISKILSNSFFQTQEGMKTGRLDTTRRSYLEAESGLTKRGSLEHGRILIGCDDDGQLIILDGRHLLHAFALLQKTIPLHTLAFESDMAYRLFTSLYQGSAIS